MILQKGLLEQEDEKWCTKKQFCGKYVKINIFDKFTEKSNCSF